MSDSKHLKPGCRCYVRLPDGLKARGIFMGYALVGEMNALVFKTDGGTTRMIPETQIIHIDILEGTCGGQPPEKAQGNDGYFYG